MNSMSTSGAPASCMADFIADFLKYHRALGKSFANEENALRLFDRYLLNEKIGSIDQVNSTLLSAFLLSRPRTTARSYIHLHNVVERFFHWLVRQQLLLHSPMETCPRRRQHQHLKAPFLFEPSQVERLLVLAAQLPDEPHSHQRGSTYRMIFGLMYALGLRVGEAERLCLRDVDLNRQTLLIRETKFLKTRIVPFGPNVAAALERYIDERQQRHGRLEPEAPLFSVHRNGRQALASKSMSRTFHHLVPHLNLVVAAGVSPPRLHCLRHSFAVSTLLRWYRSGSDPGARLLYLSTFLGHVNPASTSVYLTITADLYEQANERFHQFSAPILKKVLP